MKDDDLHLGPDLGAADVAGGGRVPPFRKYQLLTLGTTALLPLLRYELLMLTVNDLPGMAGLFLRQKLYRSLFGSMGKRVLLGRGLTLRQPQRVHLGDGAIIDDACMFNVRGEESRLVIGRGVFIGRCTYLNARGGSIEIGDHANLSSHIRVGTYSRVLIGRHAIIAAFCYIGGVDHRTDRTDIPMALQGCLDKGGVVLEDDVWLGAGVIVNDGVTIGKGAVVGAGSVVTRDIPPYAVAYGVPARVVRSRLDRPGGRD